MKREIRGRRVLITGASGGIGRCLAEQAAQSGARLVLAARTLGPLEELADRLRQATSLWLSTKPGYDVLLTWPNGPQRGWVRRLVLR